MNNTTDPGFELTIYNYSTIIFNIFLVFFVGFLYGLLIYAYLIFKHFKSKNKEKLNVKYFPILIHKFIPCGISIMTIKKSSIVIEELKFFLCCCYKKYKEINFTSIVDIDVSYCSYSVPTVIFDIISGFIISFWLHFLPCFGIWSCDGGKYDQIQIRGGIWFIGWPIISLLLIINLFKLVIL